MTLPETLTVSGVTLRRIRCDERAVVWSATICEAPRSRLLVRADLYGDDRTMYRGALVVDGRHGLWTAMLPTPEEAAEDLAALLADLRAALAGVTGGGA